MPAKPKAGAPRPRRGARTSPAAARAQEPTAADRLAELERQAAACGVKPIADFDQFLDEVGDAWPRDENLDEFLRWLQQSRREGRY